MWKNFIKLVKYPLNSHIQFRSRFKLLPTGVLFCMQSKENEIQIILSHSVYQRDNVLYKEWLYFPWIPIFYYCHHFNCLTVMITPTRYTKASLTNILLFMTKFFFYKSELERHRRKTLFHSFISASALVKHIVNCSGHLMTIRW